MSSVSDIKLIRTDTTLDLSQKAEKRYRTTPLHLPPPHKVPKACGKRIPPPTHPATFFLRLFSPRGIPVYTPDPVASRVTQDNFDRGTPRPQLSKQYTTRLYFTLFHFTALL